MSCACTAREALKGSPYRLVDDLSVADVNEKKHLRPLMDDLYKNDKKPSFRNGRLFSKGKPVPTHEIETFLSRLSPHGDTDDASAQRLTSYRT